MAGHGGHADLVLEGGGVRAVDDGQAWETSAPFQAVDVDVRAQAAPPHIKDTLEAIGLFVGPTTLLAALVFWIGWARTESFWSTLGVHHSVLAMSKTDYMMRATDTVYTVFGSLFIAVCALVLLHRTVTGWIRQGQFWIVQLLSRC